MTPATSATRRAVVTMLAAVLAGAWVSGCGDAAGAGHSARGPFGYSRDQPLNPRVRALGAYAGDEVKAVTYAGADGDRVPGVLALPPGKTAVPCAVFVPGLRRSKADVAPFVAPLRSLGVGVLAIDPPYQGARAQGPAAFDRVLQDPTRVAAMFRQTVIDVRRGLDFLDTRPECDSGRLGFIGFSFGAVIGALTSASDTRIRSTVLISTSADWRPALGLPGVILSPTESRSPAVISAYLRTIDPYNPARWVGRIAPRSLLFVNGRHDEVTTVAAEEALQRAGGKGSVVFWYDGGHNTLASPQAAQVLQRVVQYLQHTLVGAR